MTHPAASALVEAGEWLPRAALLAVLLATVWRWWTSAASHVCDLLTDIFRVVEKIADNGLVIRLQVTYEDTLSPEPPPNNGNREDLDNGRK